MAKIMVGVMRGGSIGFVSGAILGGVISFLVRVWASLYWDTLAPVETEQVAFFPVVAIAMGALIGTAGGLFGGAIAAVPRIGWLGSWVGMCCGVVSYIGFTILSGDSFEDGFGTFEFLWIAGGSLGAAVGGFVASKDLTRWI